MKRVRKYTYLPQEEIEVIETKSGQTIKSKEILDGNYVKAKPAPKKVVKKAVRKKYADGGMMAKGGKLVGNQKKLDVNKNGKLDAEDFKMLRGEKMADGGSVQSKYIITYDDGDDISRVWVNARNKEDAKEQAFEEYSDIKEIISVEKMMADGGSIQDIEKYVAKKYFNGDGRGFSVSKNMKGKYEFYINNHEQFEADYGDSMEQTNKIEEDINKTFQTMAKGGKTPIVRTQFEEEEFEYADGGKAGLNQGTYRVMIGNRKQRILADDMTRDEAKDFMYNYSL